MPGSGTFVPPLDPVVVPPLEELVVEPPELEDEELLVEDEVVLVLLLEPWPQPG